MSRLVALLVAIAIVLVAPAAVLSWQLSNGLRRDLHAQDADVRVIAGPIGIATGRIALLQVRAEGVPVEEASVREFRADLRGVEVDRARAFRGELAIRRVARGRIGIVMGEREMERYLSTARDVRAARVGFDNGLVTIHGSVNVLGASFDVEITARLAVSGGGREIVLLVDSLNLAGIAIPPNLGNALATAVNPVLVAPQQPVPMRFTGVRVDRGRAVITGEPLP